MKSFTHPDNWIYHLALIMISSPIATIALATNPSLQPAFFVGIIALLFRKGIHQAFAKTIILGEHEQ